MKTITLLLSALMPLACLTTPHLEATKVDKRLQEIKQHPDGPSIKLLLLQDVEGALVEVKGPYNLYDPRTGKQLDSAFATSSYYMYPTNDGIKWGEEFPGVYQLLIVPDRPTDSVLVAGIEYRGMIYVYQIDGTLGFVNEVTLDDYTDSILSCQLSPQVTDKEAIAALAIATRGDAAFKSMHPATKYWDIKAASTGYQGSGVTRTDQVFRDAIQMTSRMLLSTKSGDLMAVSWFKGKTLEAPFKEIQELAAQGKDAKAILAAYFPDGKIAMAETNPNKIVLK